MDSRPNGRARHRAALIATAVGGALAVAAAGADAPDTLEQEIVVTAARMTAPLVVDTDPRLPRQPLPAHDGADYLKTIPGFSVIRKGGTDGDPLFRGMAASRVNMLLDGESVLGGCGMRMDPPTAYVFPASYDRILVVKGPQSVVNGPGNSAATVRFDREPPRLDTTGVTATGSLTGASFGRTDLVGDVTVGGPRFYGRAIGTRAESSDYTDGAGNEVHSAYQRWSANMALGWRPTDSSWMEVSGARSDGEAAYADRAMDGVLFDRENLSLRFAVTDVGGTVRRVEGLVYRNYVDHVMDNFSLRDFTPTAMMPGRSVSNPDRLTEGARVALELAGEGPYTATIGADGQRNEHRVRSTMNEDMRPYRSLSRTNDAQFENYGVFAEVTRAAPGGHRLIAGARADHWWARDDRTVIALGMMGTLPNPTAGAERSTTLVSGFGRYERVVSDATAYIGLGYVERFPDYWELIGQNREAVDSLSPFGTRPERTTQLDTGVVYAAGPVTLSVSAFASEVDDYILIESGYRKGMRTMTVTRNVDARTWGGEVDAGYTFAQRWRASGSLAWVQGTNRSDDTPLGQMPPLETRLALDYRGSSWSFGGLLRGVARQDRVALNQGNIVGQDIGPTAGFAVVSLNGGYRLGNGVRMTAGVDNVFDRAYAEHISRAGSMVSGFEQTTRVNEPGRTAWINVAAEF